MKLHLQIRHHQHQYQLMQKRWEKWRLPHLQGECVLLLPAQCHFGTHLDLRLNMVHSSSCYTHQRMQYLNHQKCPDSEMYSPSAYHKKSPKNNV